MNNTYNPENFVVEVEEKVYGIGVEPEAHITGFFEILCLLTSELDSLDQYTGDVMEFPTNFGASAYAAGGALQRDPKNPGRLLGQAAAEMKPTEFVDYVSDFKEFIPVAAMSPLVIDLMRDRAKVVEARGRELNVVRVNFRQRRKV